MRWRGDTVDAGLVPNWEQGRGNKKPLFPRLWRGGPQQIRWMISERWRRYSWHIGNAVLCFIETWLQEYMPDSNSTIPGFQTVWADRDYRQCGKRKWGGLHCSWITDGANLAMLLWRTASVGGHWTVSHELASLLSAEGAHMRHHCCHLHFAITCEVIKSVTTRLLNQQHSWWPQLGITHNHIYTYGWRAACDQRWSQEANEPLQNCFDVMDWDVLPDFHGKIHQLQDTMNDFCVDTIMSP